MKKFTTSAAVTLSVLGLAGCAAADNSAAPKKVEQVSQPGAVSEATTTTAAAPAVTTTTLPPKPAAFRLGDAVELPNGDRVALHQLADNVTDDLWTAAPGTRYMATEVEGCAGKEATDFNPFSFSLQMADNTRLQPGIDVREPGLHSDTVLPGDCIRGWITFEVPAGQQPKGFLFEGSAWDSSSIVKWQLG